MSYKNEEIEKLREAVCRLPITSNGKRRGFTHELRSRIVAAFEESELTPEEFVGEVGLKFSVLSKWRRDLKQMKNQSSGFKRIQVTSDQQGVSKHKVYTLEGTRGFRLVGLSLADAIEALRCLC